jgi:glycine/D-amino acid oxidase-like deaminating enzyme
MYDVRTPRGMVRTQLVIYATNAYTSHLLPQLTGPDGIVPVRGQVAAIRANVGYMDEGDTEGITRSGWSGMFALASFWFNPTLFC